MTMLYLGRQKWEVFGVEVCRCNWLFSSPDQALGRIVFLGARA